MSLLAVAGLMMLAATAGLAGDQDFTLENRTGAEIHKLYCAPHSSDEWGEDILGRDTLADGESVSIHFANKTKPAHWDLRVEDSKGNSLTWTDLNLLEISEVVLHYKDGRAWADLK